MICFIRRIEDWTMKQNIWFAVAWGENLSIVIMKQKLHRRNGIWFTYKFGVTRRSRKESTLNLDEKFGLDKLNEQFTSLEPLPENKLNIEMAKTKFQFAPATQGVVQKTIHTITSNSTGPDNLPPKLFKLLSRHISRPISDIINCSFETGTYPSALKHISITPIPKVEEPSHTSQFRPISNANFLSKIISKITCSQMNKVSWRK